jgi:hypothetical protein
MNCAGRGKWLMSVIGIRNAGRVRPYVAKIVFGCMYIPNQFASAPPFKVFRIRPTKKANFCFAFLGAFSK